jgi:hypothetical protein
MWDVYWNVGCVTRCEMCSGMWDVYWDVWCVLEWEMKVKNERTVKKKKSTKTEKVNKMNEKWTRVKACGKCVNVLCGVSNAFFVCARVSAIWFYVCSSACTHMCVYVVMKVKSERKVKKLRAPRLLKKWAVMRDCASVSSLPCRSVLGFACMCALECVAEKWKKSKLGLLCLLG